MPLSDCRYAAAPGGREFHTIEWRLTDAKRGEGEQVWACVVCGRTWKRTAMQKKAYEKAPCKVVAKRREKDGGQCLLDGFT